MTPGRVPSGGPGKGAAPDRWAGLAVAGVVLCCGLPALLAAGGAFTVLGLGLRSWVLLTAGIVAALAGGLDLALEPTPMRNRVQSGRGRLSLPVPVGREATRPTGTRRGRVRSSMVA